MARSVQYGRQPLRSLRRTGRWSKREIELLWHIYPNAAREGNWERLFEVLGRSYVAIREKWRALGRRPRG